LAHLFFAVFFFETLFFCSTWLAHLNYESWSILQVLGVLLENHLCVCEQIVIRQQYSCIHESIRCTAQRNQTIGFANVEKEEKSVSRAHTSLSTGNSTGACTSVQDGKPSLSSKTPRLVNVVTRTDMASARDSVVTACLPYAEA
jgi:hypothetical protein